MKNLLILPILFFLCSCTKHDDIKPTCGPDTIVGIWKTNASAGRSPTFTADSVLWDDGISPSKYILKGDTVVVVYPDNSTWPRLTYKIDCNTLTLRDFWAPMQDVYTYTRVK